jgi:RNA polymerase sigma-70 factor, ECF subfamily
VSASSAEEDADIERAARLISELPQERQQILALSLVYGFSHGQIADRTGVPLGTVKSTVRRSLLWIRDQLGLDVDPRASQGGAP